MRRKPLCRRPKRMSDLGLGRVKELETRNSELLNLVRQLQLQVQQLQAQPAVVSCGQARKQGHPSLKEMRAMGVTIAEAKCGGYESAEAGAAGYSATEMRASGYTVDEVSISLTALKLSGMTCADAKAAGYVDGIKAAGYSLHEARVAGYSPTELRRAGYTCAEFKAADLTCHEAEAAGFSSREGADAGYCCCGSGGCYFHEWHSTDTHHCRKALQQSTDPAPAPAGGFLAPAAATPASVKDSIAEEGRVAFEKLFKSANSNERLLLRRLTEEGTAVARQIWCAWPEP